MHKVATIRGKFPAMTHTPEHTASKFLEFLAKRWKVLTLFSALACFGFALWYGSRQSVWFDEAYSISLIQSSFSKLLHLTSIDAHPPFYYLVLKVWGSIFGNGETALRAFSALCGAGATLFASLLVKRLFGSRVAVSVLPFLVFAPFLIRYNFEIRMYALASLIGIAATYVLVLALEKSTKKYWLLYALLIALGMYTLYFTVLLWTTHLVWLLYRWVKTRPQKPLTSQGWFFAFIGSCVLYIPWLPTFIEQLQHSVDSGVAKAVDFTHVVNVFSLGLRYLAYWELGAWGSLFIVSAIAAIAFIVSYAYRSLDRTKRQSFLLIFFYLLIPFIILTLASLPPLKPRYLERYISHVFIGGYMLLGVSIGILLQARIKIRVVLAVSILLLSLMGLGTIHLYRAGNFTFERLLEPRAKQISKLIDCSSDDIVLAGEPMLYYELHYYLPKCHYRFYSVYGDIGERGGFASLHDSPMQVRDGDRLEAKRVFYVYLDEEPFFQLPNYKLEGFTQIGKYRLGNYVLN